MSDAVSFLFPGPETTTGALASPSSMPISPHSSVPRPTHSAEAVGEGLSIGPEAKVESFAADCVIGAKLDQDVATARDDHRRPLKGMFDSQSFGEYTVKSCDYIVVYV